MATTLNDTDTEPGPEQHNGRRLNNGGSRHSPVCLTITHSDVKTLPIGLFTLPLNFIDLLSLSVFYR